MAEEARYWLADTCSLHLVFVLHWRETCGVESDAAKPSSKRVVFCPTNLLRLFSGFVLNVNPSVTHQLSSDLSSVRVVSFGCLSWIFFSSCKSLFSIASDFYFELMSVENLERAKSTKMGVSKKYSSCPLKKRPVNMVKDEVDDSKGKLLLFFLFLPQINNFSGIFLRFFKNSFFRVGTFRIILID